MSRQKKVLTIMKRNKRTRRSLYHNDCVCKWYKQKHSKYTRSMFTYV